MIINRVEFENFRNISHLVLEPARDLNVIYGENAQGKTNILEGIWLFCGFRSFRGAKDNELIRFGEGFYRASLVFNAFGREQNIRISAGVSQKRIIMNDVPVRMASTLVGNFCCVVFSLTYLSLIKGGPNERRKYLDTALCQIDPQYTGILKKFSRVLDQRNALIKEIKYNGVSPQTLDIWDEKLAEAEIKIIKKRVEYLDQIRSVVPGIQAGLSDNREVITLDYLMKVSSSAFREASPDISESYIIECLKNNRDKDIYYGTTETGVHHDEVDISVNGKSVKKYASQGQQRSAALALKLAEAELLSQNTGEKPVILLDDVMSELDLKRQDYILNHIRDRQVFITCCEPAAVLRLSGGRSFRIVSGSVGE